MTHARHIASTICLLFLCCLPITAQIDTHAITAVTPQPEVPQDALGRTTPRGTVLGFLSAAHKGDYDLAVRYLNTPKHDKAALELARQLSVVLDRRLPAKLNQLTDQHEGTDRLQPDRELVGTINSDNGNVEINVERTDHGNTGAVWLFSSDTLESIPELYDEINLVSVNSVLPDYIVKTQFAGIVLFQWLAVLVGMPLFYLVTSLLNRVLSQLVSRLRQRWNSNPDQPRLHVLPIPIRLLLLAFVIRWLLDRLSLPLLARQFWFSTASVITIAACAWLLILSISWVEQFIRRRIKDRRNSEVATILPLVRWAINGMILFVALLVALYHFGVNPTAALAGLGVGGIAVALAAQKTLENIIGGVSLIADRVVSVGDVLKVGETSGTIVEIGLRSTRIRTFDRTMVSVPNGQIANMTLETLTARDKFWFHPILRLRFGTSSTQMKAVLDSIRKIMNDSPLVEQKSLYVHLLCFGPYSFDVEIWAYIMVQERNKFLEIQESLMLKIMACIESAGVQMALSQESFLRIDTSSATDSVEGPLSKALAQEYPTSAKPPDSK